MSFDRGAYGRPHIDVCIATYRRPDMLRRLLMALGDQETQDLFSLGICVADNDPSGSAEPIVCDVREQRGLAIRYTIQPVKNLSLTRNEALTLARGDFIVLIDDDTVPAGSDWLSTLFKTMTALRADVVHGPVEHVFPQGNRSLVPATVWPRRRFLTGTTPPWDARLTNNCMIRTRVLEGLATPFDPDLGLSGGEDLDLFLRLERGGRRLVWCDEALAHESVHSDRAEPRVVLRRKFHGGQALAMVLRRHARWQALVQFLTAHLLVILGVALTLGAFVAGGFRSNPRSFFFLAKTTHQVGRLAHFYTRAKAYEYA